jgi:hypothetical protein
MHLDGHQRRTPHTNLLPCKQVQSHREDPLWQRIRPRVIFVSLRRCWHLHLRLDDLDLRIEVLAMLLSQAVFTVDLLVMTSEELRSGEEHRTHIHHIYPHTFLLYHDSF